MDPDPIFRLGMCLRSFDTPRNHGTMSKQGQAQQEVKLLRKIEELTRNQATVTEICEAFPDDKPEIVRQTEASRYELLTEFEEIKGTRPRISENSGLIVGWLGWVVFPGAILALIMGDKRPDISLMLWLGVLGWCLMFYHGHLASKWDASFEKWAKQEGKDYRRRIAEDKGHEYLRRKARVIRRHVEIEKLQQVKEKALQIRGIALRKWGHEDGLAADALQEMQEHLDFVLEGEKNLIAEGLDILYDEDLLREVEFLDEWANMLEERLTELEEWEQKKGVLEKQISLLEKAIQQRIERLRTLLRTLCIEGTRNELMDDLENLLCDLKDVMDDIEFGELDLIEADLDAIYQRMNILDGLGKRL